jgi:hypothetical protein
MILDVKSNRVKSVCRKPEVWCTKSWVTSRNPFNINFGIKNERQNFKIGTVCVGGVFLAGEDE